MVVIWGSIASVDQSSSTDEDDAGKLVCANPTFIILSVFGLIMSSVFLGTGTAITRYDTLYLTCFIHVMYSSFFFSFLFFIIFFI